MTRVTLHWREGCLAGVESRGHSGFAARGRDVVCAALSTLLQTLLLGLSDLPSLESEARPEVPLLRFSWAPQPDAERLTRAVVSALREIQAQYPGHVRIIETGISETGILEKESEKQEKITEVA